MSVLKSKRKPSQFEVFHHLNKMRKEVTDLLLRDFGYDLDKAVKKVETTFGGRPYEELSPDEKVRYEKLMEKNIAFAEWFIANELGITVNTRKTRICKLSEHWRFLQVQYSLTDTGRVIQKINPKRLTAMRRKMKKLAPKLTEKEFTDFYKSWFKNHYKIMSKKQRSNMDTLFNQLKEVTKCTLSPLPMAKS